VSTAQAFGQVTRQDSARDVLRNRAARVEDLRVAEAVLRPQKFREELLELGAQKAGRAEPVGLKDDDDARRAGLRRGDGRADLLTVVGVVVHDADAARGDRKSTRLNSSHVKISYAVFCLKKKK